jgi:hypothetical protein
MKLALFTIVIVILYVLMSWLTLRAENNKAIASKNLFLASLLTICILWPIMYANLFWAFFASMLVVIVALYIGHSREKEYGNYIRNGVLGSIWLTLPLYVYLTSYS